jgi:hypothetical protein
VLTDDHALKAAAASLECLAVSVVQWRPTCATMAIWQAGQPHILCSAAAAILQKCLYVHISGEAAIWQMAFMVPGLLLDRPDRQLTR